jgi:hypothetical protein
MAVRSKSSRLFMERAGRRPTVPHPHPVHDARASPAHTLPLAPPLPNPELLGPTQGSPPPDRGETTPWPYGT